MEAPPAKRPRLSMACNQCRRRKVKCDAEYPKCRHCRQRNDECITTDPRRPGVPMMREWLDLQSTVRNNTASTILPREDEQSSDLLSPHDTATQSINESLSKQSEVPVISPVHQPHEMSFNIDTATNRIKMLGASSSQCLSKSLDMYFKSANSKPLSSIFSHGMRHVEELKLGAVLGWPALPDPATCTARMDIFFTRIHVLYPIFDIDFFKANVIKFASISSLESLPREQIPLLVSAYLVMSLGADEISQRRTPEGDKFLEAAAGLVAHVIFMPYLASVQCLLLFTLVCRGRNQDGVGWQTLGMAVRIAQTLGLHRHSAVQPSTQHGVQKKVEQLFHARIWAIGCCLEKTMQLESGRPSMIAAVDTDQMMGRDQRPPGPDFLQWLMGLAQYQERIIKHIYGHKPGQRTARTVLLDTAELDGLLLAWANEVPAQYRPGAQLFCSMHEYHFAAFMSIQYYQAMIALHRAGLIAPTAVYEAEIATHCSGDPSEFRLRKGEYICIHSAREIATLTLELADRKTSSRVLNAGPPLLACIVIAIYLMKNPNNRLRTADLELLKECANYTSDHYLDSGHDPRFATGVITIYEQVKAHFDAIGTKNRRFHARPTHASGDKTNGVSSQPAMQSEIKTVPPSASHDSDDQVDGQRAFANSNGRLQSENQETLAFDYGVDGNNSSNNDEMSDGAALFPFDGLNVEDLWNWMLVTDAMEPTDEPGWMGTGIIQESSETLHYT